MKEKELNRKGCNIHNKKIKIAYILNSFPDNTETFVLNEIVGLSRLGMDITNFSIYKSVGYKNTIDQKLLQLKIVYADPIYSLHIILSHIYYFFRRPSVYLKLLFNFKEYGGKKAFWEGVYFSKKIKKLGIEHVHAHFAWKATDVARLISYLTSIPFSFTAHARDIYVEADYLKEKLEEAKFIVTCVRNNKHYLTQKFGEIIQKKIKVVYHGIDLRMFKPTENKEKVVDLLSIGNLVEKKGFQYLIEACEILKKRGILLKCLVIGEGHLKTQLVNMIKELDLENYIELINRKPQSELLQIYAKSRIFVLPSFITYEGDRDGIPNVLAEAMVMGMPVISSNIPNISELIEHEKDGILVRDKDPQALSDAIDGLMNDNEKRIRLGKNARNKIVKEFDSRRHYRNLASIFRSTVQQSYLF